MTCFQGIQLAIGSPIFAAIVTTTLNARYHNSELKVLVGVVGDVLDEHQRLSFLEKVDELLHGDRHLQYSRAMFIINECKRKYSEKTMMAFFERKCEDGEDLYSREFRADMEDLNKARTVCNV